MNDPHEPVFPRPVPADEREDIGQLLRLAGPREAVPVDRMRRIKTAARAEWHQQVQLRSRRKSIGWSLGAIAAAALVLVALRLSVRDAAVVQSQPRDLATIEAVSGAVRLVAPSNLGTEPRLFDTGDRIREGGERWAFYLDLINVLKARNVTQIDSPLVFDPASNRPGITELAQDKDVPFFPSFGIRFWF